MSKGNHLLDNPIWSALNSGNQLMAVGNEHVKYYQPQISPFVGMDAHTPENFSGLQAMARENSFFILFSVDQVDIPLPWTLTLEMPLYQMVCEDPGRYAETGVGFIELETEHVPDMLELTRLTNPGPFMESTIDFGSYTGIYKHRQLVAMAGWRMQPSPYIEISAVCTHPDHTGKGYAGMLIREQMKRIAAQGATPFLHVKTDNGGAIGLYEKLGFRIRKELSAYVFNNRG